MPNRLRLYLLNTCHKLLFYVPQRPLLGVFPMPQREYDVGPITRAEPIVRGSHFVPQAENFSGSGLASSAMRRGGRHHFPGCGGLSSQDGAKGTWMGQGRGQPGFLLTGLCSEVTSQTGRTL